MKVFVYFNLHRKLWSVKALDGKARGKVIAHCERVIVRGASFKVSEAGRQRVLREGRKNVHAGIVGELEAYTGYPTPANPTASLFPYGTWTNGVDTRYARQSRDYGQCARYNPRELSHFVDDNGARVDRAEMVYFAGNRKVYFFDPCAVPETLC